MKIRALVCGIGFLCFGGLIACFSVSEKTIDEVPQTVSAAVDVGEEQTHDPQQIAYAQFDPVDFTVDSIENRAKSFELSEAENVWARIKWVRTLEQAKVLSEQSNRPIFLFSMYGELDGRC
jgi:hypothetical protein